MSGEVEFLPAEFDPESDPELAHEAAERATRTPRLSWRVWAARSTATIVAVGAVAVWIGTHNDSGPPSRALAGASGAPARASGAATSSAAISSARHAAPVDADLIMCALATAAWPALADALRTHLRHVRVDERSGAVCTRGADQDVVYVSARAHYGAFVLNVVVQQRGRRVLDMTPPPATASGTLLGSVHRESAGSVVDVDAYGRIGSAPPTNPLQALADDLSLNLVL